MSTNQCGVRRSLLLGLAAGLSAILVSAPVLPTSTGLNNIPTADTPPDRTIVFQSFTNLGDERDPDYVIGFKGGLEAWGQRFEFGLDSRVGEGEADPLVLQFKYALPLGEDLPTVGVGVANLALTSRDRRDVGQPFTFGVLTHDFGSFRGHAGYGFQQDNNAAFFGFDKTIKLFDRDLMLRSDFIQIDDQDQWLGSAGFIYFMHEHFAIESWISQPLQHGEPTFTLKLNLSFAF